MALKSKYVEYGLKGGRPPIKEKPDWQKYRVQLTPEQKSAYLEAADKAGLKTLSAFMRKAADQVCNEGFHLTDLDRSNLAKIDSQLRVIGRNINQSTSKLSLLTTVPQLAKDWQDRLEYSADDLVFDMKKALSDLDELSNIMKIIFAEIDGQNNS